MAEPARVADKEVNRVQEDSEEEQNETCIPSQLPNSEFTAELNLVIVFLSLFSSLPTEESLNFEECEQERNRDEAKAITKRLKTKRRETDEVKPVRRRAQRFQTRIRDFRHGRRM